MKVIIRPWSLADVPELATIANNSTIWRTLRDRFPHPYTNKDAEDFINMARDKQPVEHFCIEADGLVVGSIGVILFTENYRKNIEIGYFIGEAFWGMGVATEALRLMVLYVLANFEVIRIFALVYEHNKSSMRVLEKNGFELESIHKKAVVKNNTVLDEYIWVRFNTQHSDYQNI